METDMKSIHALIGFGLCFQASQAIANSAGFVPVPTLDDAGLAGLSAIIAMIGALAVRWKRKK
jgi:hypothetical protein